MMNVRVSIFHIHNSPHTTRPRAVVIGSEAPRRLRRTVKKNTHIWMRPPRNWSALETLNYAQELNRHGGTSHLPSWGQTNITSMLAPQADRVMTLGEWEDRWQENRIAFHQSHVHKMLENNFDKVLAGRTGVRFFFPLCGKAVDMKWLADMGHSVVGVEISEKAIQQFFEENNMTYIEEPVPAIPGAKVYKSSEKNISLYQCDLYNFSSSIEGQFGAIWDRGSLVAINPKDREKYAALIISLMASDCRYLLDTLLYNPELYKGPPFFVPDEQVTRLFGERCDIELLQSVDAMTDRQRAWGLDYLTETVHLISLKSN